MDNVLPFARLNGNAADFNHAYADCEKALNDYLDALRSAKKIEFDAFISVSLALAKLDQLPETKALGGVTVVMLQMKIPHQQVRLIFTPGRLTEATLVGELLMEEMIARNLPLDMFTQAFDKTKLIELARKINRPFTKKILDDEFGSNLESLLTEMRKASQKTKDNHGGSPTAGPPDSGGSNCNTDGGGTQGGDVDSNASGKQGGDHDDAEGDVDAGNDVSSGPKPDQDYTIEQLTGALDEVLKMLRPLSRQKKKIRALLPTEAQLHDIGNRIAAIYAHQRVIRYAFARLAKNHFGEK